MLIYSFANGRKAWQIEEKSHWPEDREVPREHAERVEPCVGFPRRQANVERAVEIFYQKIRCDFFPEFHIAEIDGFQSMQMIDEHQYKHTALAQVTDAIIENSDGRFCPLPSPL